MQEINLLIKKVNSFKKIKPLTDIKDVHQLTELEVTVGAFQQLVEKLYNEQREL